MKRNAFMNWIRWLLSAMVLLSPLLAQATCSGNVSTSPFTPSNVVINKNTPVGQVVSSATVTLRVDCNPTGLVGIGWEMNYTPQAPLVATSLGQGTFATTMPGLGFRLYSNVGTLISPTSYGTNGGDNFYPGGFGPYGAAAPSSSTTYTFRIDLVRTDTSLTSGTFSDSLIRFGYQDTGTSYCPEGGPSPGSCTQQFGSEVTTPVTFSFQNPTCSLTAGTANQTVRLPTAKTTEFSAIGVTARPTNFNISLENCVQQTAVNMSLNGTINTLSTVLANTGSATGVGLQVVYSGSPMAFNTTYPMGNVGSSTSMNIPLTAQYYRTGAMTAGSVNGVATIMMIYQ
ncbi:fimbrial protein [Cupriavidus metallidurans]|uniref:fimbrial protein n=1 Tax=Cupriavidus metallidurans TaxID=119219 RepID=UPI001CCBF7E3|nr:fimbrial protein [Cupriavidus metallidurans]UBM08287.1 fimbrial protein [Cupriavidus metallidurans]